MSGSNGNRTLSCSRMTVKELLVVLGIVYLAAITTLANDQNTSKFKRVICTIPEDSDFVANYTCRARPLNRNTTVVNLRAYVYRQIDDIIVYIRLYKKYNVYKPFLINVKENFCDLFSKKSSVPYTRLLMKLGASYTNVNHSCPYIGELFTRNASMDPNKLLDFWPSGEYRLDVTAFFNKLPSPSVKLQFFFEIGEKFFG